MQMGELFQRYGPGAVQTVVDTGEPLPLTRYGKPHAAIVANDWFERAAAALEREAAAEQEASMT